MARAPYTLPPLNALRMFESSARHLNFRLAAEELGVTQGAVAQQVRALEEHLQTKLFARLPRGLELTDAGRRYAKSVQRALTLVSNATEELVPSKTTLTISVTPSFATKWLIPRLNKISESNTSLEVQVLATNALANFQSDGVDIAVRHTKPPIGPGLHAELLFATTIFAVCSPEFMKDNPIKTQNDLSCHVLLHDAHGMWPVYLELAGADADLSNLRSRKFSHTSLAVDAAIGGQGVALASNALVADDLASGRLISPLAFKLQGELGFYIVHPRTPRNPECVKWMRAWLLSQRSSSL